MAAPPSSQELTLREKLVEAQERGRYMVAVWSIDPAPGPNGKLPLILHVNRRDFPKEDFNECLRMLNESFVMEAQKR